MEDLKIMYESRFHIPVFDVYKIKYNLMYDSYIILSFFLCLGVFLLNLFIIIVI